MLMDGPLHLLGSLRVPLAGCRARLVRSMRPTAPLLCTHHYLNLLLSLIVSRRLARLLALEGRYLVLELQDLVFVVLVGLLDIVLVLMHTLL